MPITCLNRAQSRASTDIWFVPRHSGSVQLIAIDRFGSLWSQKQFFDDLWRTELNFGHGKQQERGEGDEQCRR